MWWVGPSSVKSGLNGAPSRIFGSVLYAEYPSGDVKLNMFSADIDNDADSYHIEKQEKLYYP